MLSRLMYSHHRKRNKGSPYVSFRELKAIHLINLQTTCPKTKRGVLCQVNYFNRFRKLVKVGQSNNCEGDLSE